MSNERKEKTFTVVTALFDIGRSTWGDVYRRDTRLYMYYLSFILKMNCNICIFVEEKFVDFVRESRKGMESKTKIYTVPISSLLMNGYKEKISTIMSSEEYKANQKDPLCPEVKRPEYNIVVNSKVDLVYRVAMENPFTTDFFLWMDAGYGHGTLNIPKGFKFYPESFMKEGKVSILCLKDVSLISPDYKTFYEEHIDVVNGGFFCCDRESIVRYKEIYYYVVEDSLDKGITDDDQYTVSMSYTKDNSLFSVFYNRDWYGAFDQFHKEG
ncbi:MAG: WlaTC/HtrL family glycosyltransferase [Candidatus Colwellbacteria bacterium]|nr:WlaTC/HtrL family glycosyltransferase [Candidatus Colwellbacteria bacterium]